jgi:HEAT repeat protein
LGTRNGVAYSLAFLGADAGGAVSALTQALRDRNAKVRLAAVVALGAIGPQASDAAPALVKLFDDKDPAIRDEAIRAVAKLGPKVVPGLCDALRDKKGSARARSLAVLVNMGAEAKEAAPAASKLLPDKNAIIRYLAVRMLAEVGAGAHVAVPGLIKALQDPYLDVRLMSAVALGQIGPRARMAVETLNRMRKDPLPVVRLTAIVSLTKICKDIDPNAHARLVAELKEALAELPGGAIHNARRRQVVMRMDQIMNRFIMAATDRLSGPEALQAKIVFHQQTLRDISCIPAFVPAINVIANLKIPLSKAPS